MSAVTGDLIAERTAATKKLTELDAAIFEIDSRRAALVEHRDATIRFAASLGMTARAIAFSTCINTTT